MGRMELGLHSNAVTEELWLWARAHGPTTSAVDGEQGARVAVEATVSLMHTGGVKLTLDPDAGIFADDSVETDLELSIEQINRAKRELLRLVEREGARGHMEGDDLAMLCKAVKRIPYKPHSRR